MRYLMRKQLFAIGDDFWVEDESGRRAFRVDGKVLRIRQTFVLEDPSGAEVATIRKKLVALRDTMDVEYDGQVVARVRRAVFSPFRQRFDVDVAGGPGMVVQGNITDHEYDVRRGGATVAEISKRWFSIRDTYAVDVAPDEDVALVLALTVAVDWMGHEEHGER
ncbi:MAG: hypothetical protein E6J41_11665 [Chloroflexi bacterium]|nr:MAG: hypothetical protein E6J41_11665 [Chloroflexota bacterium]